MKAKVQLEHQVLKKITEFNLSHEKILIALSGGLDSVALFHALFRVHGKEKIAVFHFHHGENQNSDYRRQAVQFCQNLTARYEVPFFLEKAEATSAHSEAELRELRYQALAEVQKAQGFSVVAFAHHQDDLLETRLLRLIRGTGGQGLGAMDFFAPPYFRPFLGCSKGELAAYVESFSKDEPGLELFVEDPSNRSLDPLRNWVRQEWLPALEERQKGASGALSRSLDLIAQELGESSAGSDLLKANEAFKSQISSITDLSRAFFLTLGPQGQRRLLAQYLLSLGRRNFSHAHLEEIQKRLDNSQRVITFKVAGCHWDINAEQIKVQS